MFKLEHISVQLLNCPRFRDILFSFGVSEGNKGRGEAQCFILSSTVSCFSIVDNAVETRAVSTFRRWRTPRLVFVHDLVRWKTRKEVFHRIDGRVVVI